MNIKIFLSIILLIAGIFYSGCSSSREEGTLEASGTIEAKYVTLSAKSPGQIVSFPVEEGYRVNAGDTLVVVDPESPRIQLENALAAREAAQAQYDLMVSGARKEDIAQAEAAKAQAELALSQAESDKTRFEQLLKANSASQKQYDDIVTRAAIAKEQVNAAAENVKKMRQVFRPEEIRQAKAKLEQSSAAVSSARKMLNDAFILSPIAGIVTNKYFEKGESVTAMSALVKVSDLSRLELMVYLPEGEVAKVGLQDAAEISIDAFPEKTFRGIVVFISPESEFTPKNIQTKDERTKLVFAVKIEIENEGMKLKAGLPADAKIRIKG